MPTTPRKANRARKKPRSAAAFFPEQLPPYIATFNPTITAWFFWLAWLNVVL